jgi:hypothetical protein
LGDKYSCRPAVRGAQYFGNCTCVGAAEFKELHQILREKNQRSISSFHLEKEETTILK